MIKLPTPTPGNGGTAVYSDPRLTLQEWQELIQALIQHHGSGAVMFTDAGHNNVELLIKEQEPEQEPPKKEDREGWKWLTNATRWHYFRGGRSLCGRWMTLTSSGMEKGNDRSPDNCRSCARRLTGKEPS